jgi:hypothetical protein
MFATRAQQQQESPLDRQITTPAKPSFTAEFHSLNPLEQGLEDQFFGLFENSLSAQGRLACCNGVFALFVPAARHLICKSMAVQLHLSQVPFAKKIEFSTTAKFILGLRQIEQMPHTACLQIYDDYQSCGRTQKRSPYRQLIITGCLLFLNSSATEGLTSG